MTFLSPGLALLAAGIALPTIILLHVLRLRRLPQRVPSTLLWRRSVQDLEANVPFQRLRFSWLLLLQLLAALCAALAAGQPVIEHGEAPGSLAIVLDTRARMNALAELPTKNRETEAKTSGEEAPKPPTRFDLARRAARETIEREAGDGTTVHLISARARPALVTSGSPRAVLDALERLEGTEESGDADAAMALAAQMAPDGEIRWIGDPSEARRDNVGITILAAQRGIEEPGTAEVLVGAVSSYAKPMEVPLVVTLDGKVMAARLLRIPAADEDPAGAPGRATALLRIPATPGAMLEARLAADDALPIDDAAWLRFAPAAPIRVAFLAPGESAASPLFELLRLMDAVRLTTLPCDSSREALRDFDLVVADGCVPGIIPGAASRSTGAAPPSTSATPPWLVFAWPAEITGTDGRVLTAAAPIDARAHPVLQGVPPFTVDVVVPPEVDAALAGDAGAARGRIRLLDERERTLAWIDPRAPGVRFEFPLGATEWSREPSWVMTMQNAILWLVGDDGDGVGTPIRTGEPAKVLAQKRDGSRTWVEVAPMSRTGPIEVRPADGEAVSHRVSLLDERQSDLRPLPPPEDPRAREPARASSRTGDEGDGDGASERSTRRRPLWPALAMAALLLLVVEWTVYLAAMRRSA